MPSIAIGRATVDRQILPTARYDAWRVASIARRWADLAGGVAGDDPPARAGRAARRARPADQRAVAGGGTQRGAGRPPGRARRAGRAGARAPRPPPTRCSELLAWQAPRRSRGREADLPRGARRGRPAGRHRAGRAHRRTAGCCTPTTRPPSAPTESAADPLGLRPGADRSPDAPPAAVAALDALLPAPVDHVLVQADLTVVVPGPPEPELAAELESWPSRVGRAVPACTG